MSRTPGAIGVRVASGAFGLAFGLVAVAARPLGAQADPGYRVGVASESGDVVTWLRPGNNTLVIDHVVPVGVMPADIDGPHNVTVAPDARSYYVSVAHGTPFGTLWRFSLPGDSLMGRAPVELFPTTISITPDGEIAFVANSDFFGERPRVNPISIIHTPTMTKIADVPACDMPHGVKVNHAGTRVYVSCMHSDEILEMDPGTFDITRRGRAGAGHEMAGKAATSSMEHAGTVCAPTFVSASPDDRRLYVACNTGNTLQVWDAATLTIMKELPVGHGAYNVEPSPDGKLVIVTNKKDRSVSIIDAVTLTELARVPTSKGVVHGIAYSPDGRFAYISSESIGADPGAVDMIDLATRTVVASVAVPLQPTGITIWRR
ncbi:MAG: PD40 domain-containing protein [Gemmatimonadales bacterium]|nr:PD40 domain-containing protein [Gemmatimonadales bacterium]